MADDAVDKKEPTAAEVAPPVAKPETSEAAPAKPTEATPPEAPKDKVPESPEKTPDAKVEVAPVAPVPTAEEVPAVTAAADTSATPAVESPTAAAEAVATVETVESQPSVPEGSPAKTVEKEVDPEVIQPVVVVNSAAEVSKQPEAVELSPIKESTVEKPEEKTVPDQPVPETTVSVDSKELPKTAEPASEIPKSVPELPTESASAPPAEEPAKLPEENVAELPVEQPATSPVETTGESTPEKVEEVPAASPTTTDAVAEARDERQKDGAPAQEAQAAPAGGEIKPSADDSGIQELDSKLVEGSSLNGSQGSDKNAGVEAKDAQPPNDVGGAVVERPAEDEEEWSDEDEGHASYGEERGASPPKKSETVSDEEANLDFDEDKSNPQYIPKKGAFYEHDDRRGTDDEDETAEEEANKDKEAEESEVAGGSKDSPEHRRAQRVLQSETKDRWDHDMFDPNEQGPKTSDELVQQYGYDIRDESSAPRAAGRRGYGRGPNKYTRDWQDEKAYHGKTHNAQERREKEFHPRRDDFPCLPSAQRPREQQNLKESKDHQVREERQEHPRENRRQNDRTERPERNERPEPKDPRRSDQGRDNPRKDRREMTGPSYPITTHPSAWNHANPQPPLQPAPHPQAQNFGVAPQPPRSDNPRFDNAAMRGSGPPRRDFAQEQSDTGRRGAGHEKWRMEAPENRDPGRRLIGCGERELRWRREGSGRFGDHRGSAGYDLRNKLDANRHDNQRFDGRKPQRNEGWGGSGDNGGHRDHGHRDNGGGRTRGGGGDHRDFRDNGHRENFHRENSHRENWRDNRDSYRDNNRDAGRGDNRESGRDARDAGRGDAREGGRDNRDGGREIIMRQDRKIGSGRTQEPRSSRKPTEARNGEFAEQRRPSDDKRSHAPQQNGTTVESKRYTQQRAAARGDASQAAVSSSQAQPAAAQAQPQQAAHHSMPAPPRQSHAPQQPMPPQHVPQQQAYYELPGPAPYFVPQFDGAAGPPQNFIQPNPFMNHPTAYIAPPAPPAHPYMMSPEGPVAEVYAPAPGANGAPGGITYYSATQQMYMAHQPQQSQPRRKAAIPIKPPPEPKHQQHVEPKSLET